MCLNSKKSVNATSANKFLTDTRVNTSVTLCVWLVISFPSVACKECVKLANANKCARIGYAEEDANTKHGVIRIKIPSVLFLNHCFYLGLKMLNKMRKGHLSCFASRYKNAINCGITDLMFACAYFASYWTCKHWKMLLLVVAVKRPPRVSLVRFACLMFLWHCYFFYMFICIICVGIFESATRLPPNCKPPTT